MKVFWEKMINLDPKTCILNMYPNNLVPAANIRALLRIGLLEAKRCFAKCWKDKKICGLSQWLNGLTSI